MLLKILNRFKFWDSKANPIDDFEPISQYISTHRSDYSGMQVYQSLKSAKPVPPSHSRNLTTVNWQLPLPYDLIFTIVNLYFLHDKLALSNLAQACRNLAQVCEPLFYQNISITCHRNQRQVSSLEKFATLSSRSPHIIDYIQHLEIRDTPQMYQGSWAITADEERLCYILTRKYPRLRRLHISLHIVWYALPIQLQHAFAVVFTLPNLDEVVFEHCYVTTSLLTHLSKINSLEIRQGGVVFSTNLEIPNKICTPEHLLFIDHGDTVYLENLLAETSPLRLSKLKHLQIRSLGLHLERLNKKLQACSTTLTILEFRISLWEGVPDILDLRGFPVLSSLTLCADISRNIFSNPTMNVQRFSWLVNTLGTCHQPSQMEDIKFVILTRELNSALYLPWQNLDALFTPYPGTQWPRLNRFVVQYFNESKENVEVGRLEEIIFPMTPILASGLLRFRISGGHMTHPIAKANPVFQI